MCRIACTAVASKRANKQIESAYQSLWVRIKQYHVFSCYGLCYAKLGRFWYTTHSSIIPFLVAP